MNIQHHNRFNVVGTSGCGKTTFARLLAAALQLQCIELDQVYWKANWTAPSDEELFSKLASALSAESWVLDGNYKRTTPIKWSRSVCVIWLDYSFPRVLRQAIRRALRRAWTKEEMWPGTNNRESFKNLFFSKDSIVLWTLKTFHSNRRKYKAMMTSESYQHVEFIRLRNPREADELIASLSD